VSCPDRITELSFCSGIQVLQYRKDIVQITKIMIQSNNQLGLLSKAYISFCTSSSRHKMSLSKNQSTLLLSQLEIMLFLCRVPIQIC
jgi:hypothetical protein